MIGYLQGILRHVEDLDVIVDVNGVGYEVRVDRQTLETFGPIGEEVTLWVRTIVREDAFILHGFATRDHRLVFDMVTKSQALAQSLYPDSWRVSHRRTGGRNQRQGPAPAFADSRCW